MSYPGYPSYPPQGAGQPVPNQSSAPMYQTAPLTYPMYPGAAAPQAPTGFTSQYPGYPPQATPYPSANPVSGSFQQSPYPTSTPIGGSSYPSSTPSPYPRVNQPSSSPYPATGSPYPATSSPYPPTSSPYPATTSPYSATTSPYPQASPYSNSPYPASAYSSGSAPGHGTTSSYPQQPTSQYTAGATHHANYSSNYQGSQMPTYTVGGRATSNSAPLYTQSHHSAPSSARPPTPTVKPANPFNARSDAEVLRKAMKGFGTDEKALIEVLANRTNSQRQQIALEFKTLYGKDLVSDIKSEVTGKFEELLVALLTPIPDFLAKELHHAVACVGTKEETLVEIICTANNYEMKCIKAAYEKLYGISLEQDLSGDTSGNFRRLLISLCQANRNETPGIDGNAIFQDAQALMRAGELRLGTDESTFNAILCSRSYSQLAAVFSEYQRLTGNDFVNVVKSEFSGDIETGLVAIVRTVQDKSDFFAEQLHGSMAGAGTNDRALIRIVCSRSEIDLGDIKNAYHRRYGQMLSESIHGDTSGDYKKCLLKLIE